MFWFVDTYFATAGKSEGSDFPPRPLAHIRDLHIFRFEIFQGRRDVIAHEVKLVLVVVLGSVERRFEWRHCEGHPVVAGINGGKLKYIPKECSVSFRIVGIDNDMRAVDHSGFRKVTVIFSCAQAIRW